jgi:hypothetical protein
MGHIYTYPSRPYVDGTAGATIMSLSIPWARDANTRSQDPYIRRQREYHHESTCPERRESLL